MLVFAENITPRLMYTFDLVLKNLMGIDYSFTTQLEEAENHIGPKLFYSKTNCRSMPYILAHTLLFENNIHTLDPRFENRNNIPLLFMTHGESLLPFDPFAAIFYMTSRYEEYLPYKSDHYGRFEAKESLAYKMGFLERPVVNIWVGMLATQLTKLFPNLILSKNRYNYLPTIDIDNAWAYLNKGIVRTLGASAKSFVTLKLKDNLDRLKVLARIKKDPYFTYDYQNEVHNKYRINPTYFFLYGKYGKFDKNIATENLKFRKLIKEISGKHEVGIHPSWASNEDSDMLKEEINGLENVCEKKISKSRQHFVKLNLPVTYRELIKAGINEDFSMGYASACGFRAGICGPFKFYDLLAEKETNLTIYPFHVMETCLKFYMKNSQEEALEKIDEIIKNVKKIKGTFISLWHNESLSDQHEWEGWQKVYEGMLAKATDYE